MAKPNVIWKPFPGAQERFLSCPAWECLLHGSRGGGKTDVLLMDFLQGVGKGYGSDYRGLLLREATTELGDVIAKSKKWINQIFPSATFNASRKIWTFEGGETLWFNYARTEDDYTQYHGSEFCWCVEENTKILMADNSLKKIKDIKIGDSIKTLEGNKLVLNLFPSIQKAVKISFFDSNASLIGSQIQGLSHQLLTSSGLLHEKNLELPQILKPHELHQFAWLDYTTYQKYDQFPHFFSFFLQNLQNLKEFLVSFPINPNYVEDKVYLCQKSLLFLLFQLLDKIYKSLVSYFQENQENFFFSINGHNVYKNIDNRRLNILQFFQHYIYVSLKLQLLLSQKIYSPFLDYVFDYALSPLLILNYQYYYLKDFHHNDELFHQDQEICQDTFQQFYDAPKPLQFCLFDKDDLDFSPSSYHSTFYVHPYKKEFRPSLVNFSTEASCEFSFVDNNVNLYDITVQDSSHYITKLTNSQLVNSSQLKFVVNKNCGWEEITNHSTPNLYLKLMSCNRTSNPKIFRKYRATCNPSGPGHGWVKARFIDQGPPEKMIYDEFGQTRTHIQSQLSENKAMMEADPMYLAKLMAMTQDNKMLRDAWVFGSWDLVTGGFFTDIWDPRIHVLPTFKIPSSWPVYRSFDWGSSKPWSVTYGAEANGEQPIGLEGKIPYIPKGSVIIINEIYGWNGKANEGDRATSQEIAERVIQVDNNILTEYKLDGKVRPGPADTSIWEVRDGTSIAHNLRKFGCHWTKAYKGSGSRVSGWALLRQMLGAAKRGDLETPHLYFFEQAYHHIRTLPIMQRDKVKPEDIDSSLEDHCFVFNTQIITDKGKELIGNLVGKKGKALSVNGEFVDFDNCRLVKKNANLIKITFMDDYSVICTPDHKFLTNKGFIEGKNLLTLSDIFAIVSKPLKEENLLCKSWKELKKFMYCPIQNKCSEVSPITNVVNIFKKMVYDYTGKFTNFLMDLFQKDILSIIKHLIHLKIKELIWNYFHNLIIVPCMENCTQHLHLKTHWMPQHYGTKVQKEKNGIPNITKTIKNSFMQNMIKFVNIVENYTKAIEKTCTLFVQIIVNQLPEENQKLTILKETVSYVPIHLQSINITKEKPVHVYAQKNYKMEVKRIEALPYCEDVYCLETKVVHTFALGNGVVVSNCCDSARYLLSRKLYTLKQRAVKN